MSKFFVTNNKSFYIKIKNQIELSPFKTCFTKEGEIYCFSTKKLTIDNVNGKNVHDGFALVTGTMIWGEGERVSSQILDNIWETYNGNLSDIRNSCIGNYAVTIQKNKEGIVFSDLSGFYNIYYYSNDDAWIISNSLYDLYRLLKERLTIDKNGVVEYIRQSAILNGDTQFNEIKRLCGYDYLKFDSAKIERVVEKHLYPLSNDTFENQVKAYVEFSKDYATKAYKAFGKPTISMTGGMDARMLLASYLSIGVKPDLYYGTGNTLITNTHIEDKKIDRAYCEKFGLKIFEESWATPEPMDKYWDKYLKYFGFHYDIYASSNDVMTSVINNPNSYFILGEGGEMLRNQNWIDERDTDFFTLDEYINEFYIPQELRESIVDSDDFIKKVKSKYLDICNYYNLDPSHIANEDMFILTLERRKTGDSATVNWLNFIRYDSVQMIQYEGLLAARVGYRDTASAKFMLHCQNMLYPPILDIPVFSHCKMRTFNRETMTISEVISTKEQIKSFVRKNFPGIFAILKRRFSENNVHQRSENTEVYSRAIELYDMLNSDNLFNIEKFTDQRYLIKYVMFLNALK